ncbi:MAG: Hin recombinase, partial [Roseburia sp.]|nr:Hin recombinase [Roseburia sp.]
MGNKNERGAGRKPTLGPEVIREIQKRRAGGETVTALAREYGVSRQTLSGYLTVKEPEQEQICSTIRKWMELNQKFREVNVMDYTMRMEYMCEEELCTVILVDFKGKKIAAYNETDNVIH